MNSFDGQPSYDFTLSRQVSLADYVDAARQRWHGDSGANPLTQAICEHTYFALTSYRRGELRVIDRRNGTRYFGSASPDLAACMSSFERGEPIGACRSFELALSSDN
jgi:hypothetical protein